MWQLEAADFLGVSCWSFEVVLVSCGICTCGRPVTVSRSAKGVQIDIAELDALSTEGVIDPPLTAFVVAGGS